MAKSKSREGIYRFSWKINIIEPEVEWDVWRNGFITIGKIRRECFLISVS